MDKVRYLRIKKIYINIDTKFTYDFMLSTSIKCKEKNETNKLIEKQLKTKKIIIIHLKTFTKNFKLILSIPITLLIPSLKIK